MSQRTPPSRGSGTGDGRTGSVPGARFLGGVLMLGLAWVSGRAWGAEIHTEAFAGGAGGWTASGSLQVAAVDEGLRGSFAAQGFPVPESGSFVANPTASGGAFAGDYAAAGIQLVGFSFMARDVLPSAALVRWTGPSASFFRSFAGHVTRTGVWYRLAFPLKEEYAGRWIGGGAEAFAAGLADVRSLEIQLTRTGVASQRYEVDDVFVDRLPTGACAVGTNGAQVLCSALRTNTAYVVEAAGAPDRAWEEAGAFVASQPVQAWMDGGATGRATRVYRLRFDEAR